MFRAWKIAIAIVALAPAVDSVPADEPVLLVNRVGPTQAFDCKYRIEINGEIITPSADGAQKFPITSVGAFEFGQRQARTESTGPASIKGIRNFVNASTTTTVGKDHVTKVTLPDTFRTIQVAGSDSGLVQFCPKYLLPRQQLDLLQMPFDPLAINSILPSGKVAPGEKWNVDDWVMPTLTGTEAVVEQSTTCSLKSLKLDSAVVAFSGKINGAVRGSASNVSFSGELTLDRQKGFVRSFAGQLKEKRTPGPVSPGLDITANIRWNQKPSSTPSSIPSLDKFALPTESKTQLVMQTPLKLQLRHSREWYLFHQTPAVLMLRQLRDGHLISQCNISTTVTVPPKQHTPDKEFRNDVEESVKERKGAIVGEDTIREDDQWRIRHVEAVGDAAGDVIKWDYYLCSATTGEQFSIVFSHAREDDKLFAGEAEKILSTLKTANIRRAQGPDGGASRP